MQQIKQAVRSTKQKKSLMGSFQQKARYHDKSDGHETNNCNGPDRNMSGHIEQRSDIFDGDVQD